MKKFFFLLAMLIHLSTWAQQSKGRSISYIQSISELKMLQPADSVIVFLSGVNTFGDNNGALYRYNMANNSTGDDTKYFNSIKSAVMPQGTWERLNVRMRDYPQGILETNGSRRTFWVQGVTNANGEVTVYTTTDNTATGPSLFNSYWFHSCIGQTAATTANDVITGCLKSKSADGKILVYKFAKGGSTTLVVGGIAVGLSNPTIGTPVMIKIDGM